MPIRQEEWEIDRLRPDPANVELFDALPEEELTALGLSIKAHGMINPIAVRADGTIIAGEQRWRAAQQAGVAAVPVRIYDVDEHQATILRIAENLHRRNLKASEVTRAIVRLYQEMYPEEADEKVHDQHFRLSHKQRQPMADFVGYSATYISNLWARRLLVSELVALEDRGLLDRNLAQSLTRLPQEQQRRLAALCNSLIQRPGADGGEARQAVREVGERVAALERDKRELERELEKARKEQGIAAPTAPDEDVRVQRLQQQLDARQQEMEKLLTSKEQELDRLRHDLDSVRRFEQGDHLHKTMQRLALIAGLDPTEMVARLVGREGMPHILALHRETLDVALPWLQRYHAALAEALGPEPLRGDQMAARRARRAVGQLSVNWDETDNGIE